VRRVWSRNLNNSRIVLWLSYILSSECLDRLGLEADPSLPSSAKVMNVWLCITTPSYALMTWHFINPFSAQWPICQPLLRLPKMRTGQTISLFSANLTVHTSHARCFTLLQRVQFRISVSTDCLHLDLTIVYSAIFIFMSSIDSSRCVLNWCCAHIYHTDI
jgi:hypothetical protein